MQGVRHESRRTVHAGGGPGPHVAILGAGLAGLSSAHFLKQGGWTDLRVYERHPYGGGHATSFSLTPSPASGGGPGRERGPFYFDEGPHVSFTKNEFVRDFLAESVAGEFDEQVANLSNYYRGHWLKHPAQCNLHGLPVDLIERCILDMIEQAHGSNGSNGTPPRDYAEWCTRSLGETFSREFTFRYTRKYWTLEAEQMTTDWVGSRMYPPSIGDVVRGALTSDTDGANHHYLTRFRYPRRGGFGTFTRRLVEGAPVAYEHEVTEVDVEAKRIKFANGAEAGYDLLVSSLPLPELIRRIPQAPADVRQAAERLSCSSVVLVSLGVDRADLSPFHWFYVYDEDIPFARVNLTHKLAPACAPEGCGAIQAEIYFSRYRPLWASLEELTEQTIAGLQRIGVLRPDDGILVRDTRVIRYANVIFDHDRAPALEVVHGYLDDQGIQYCGRYGEWAYLWTDDAILSGKRVAETVLGKFSVERLVN